MEWSQVNGLDAHRAYYAQFVSPLTISNVLNVVGKERILQSTDEHLNDIPLHQWSRAAEMMKRSMLFKSAGDYYTDANGVCVVKEAARQFKESVK
jgi:hypothetical protein